MNNQPIIYLGDMSLNSAAAYLGGLMSSWELPFDYVPSDAAFDVADAKVPRKLFIISDYPSKLMNEAAQQAVLEQVRAGSGLLMIGGWESYCGMGGNWGGTLIGNALPVEISRTDDRVNCDQPALLLKTHDHPIIANLPWDQRPPTVGGFNRFASKKDSATLLEVERFAATRQNGVMQFQSHSRSPMLVVGVYGKGRTAALATDVAPHWVGGWVDWGTGRVTGQAAAAAGIEVGDLYAQFFKQLLFWTGNI
jgi:hypothetical protein